MPKCYPSQISERKLHLKIQSKASIFSEMCCLTYFELLFGLYVNVKCLLQALLQWIDNGTGNSDQQSGKPTLAFQDFRQWLIKCLSILADESI